MIDGRNGAVDSRLSLQGLSVIRIDLEVRHAFASAASSIAS
jgi:hypothetical protein